MEKRLNSCNSAAGCGQSKSPALGGSVSVDNRSVSIGGITGGSVVISGRKSCVSNGQCISAGQGSTICVGGETVNLKIGIPKTLLANVILRAVRTSAGTIKTIRGDIQLVDVNGNLEIEATEGDVQSEQGSGDIRIVTVSGDVRVRNRTQGLISTQTTSGNIRYSNPDQSAREEAKTLSGDISGMKKCSDALYGKKASRRRPVWILVLNFIPNNSTIRPVSPERIVSFIISISPADPILIRIC